MRMIIMPAIYSGQKLWEPLPLFLLKSVLCMILIIITIRIAL